MSGDIERAQLYTVSGPIDNPKKGKKSISVMFNPTSLKVTLANSLKENERNNNSRAAQYVDKSSSSLSVELIFDTTLDLDKREVKKGEERITIDVSKDVRKFTGAIAKEFMKQPDVGKEGSVPKRCMFIWGTFVFVGIMESFDETLDFFSWEGTPLRATVAIKMTESRFQFKSIAAKEAARNTPALGANNDTPHKAARAPHEWRDSSLYNGVESPRMPSESPLASPSASAMAGLSASVGISGGISAGVGIGASAGIGGGLGISGGVSSGMSLGISASASVGGNMTASAIMKSTPAFSFGASSSIGTGIPGAFSPNTKISAGLTAGSIIAVSASAGGINATTINNKRATGNLSSSQTTARANVNINSKGIKASGSLGFD